MSATRTQIYLTEDQRARIDRVVEAEGVSMAELIRRALDQYLGDDTDPSASLAATFGAVPSAAAPSRDTWRRV
jgi:metal-responsive CopG/Arc/MetJ family transcriptional regulator